MPKHGSGDVLERLEALAPQLPSRIEELQAKRDQLNEEIDALTRLHAVMAPPHRPASVTPAKRRRPKVRAHTRISTDRLASIAGVALELDGTFTVAHLIERSGMTPSAVRAAVARLREMQFLGAQGKDRTSTAPRKPELYRVIDPSVLQLPGSEVAERPQLAAVA